MESFIPSSCSAFPCWGKLRNKVKEDLGSRKLATRRANVTILIMMGLSLHGLETTNARKYGPEFYPAPVKLSPIPRQSESPSHDFLTGQTGKIAPMRKLHALPTESESVPIWRKVSGDTSLTIDEENGTHSLPQLGGASYSASGVENSSGEQYMSERSGEELLGSGSNRSVDSRHGYEVPHSMPLYYYPEGYANPGSVTRNNQHDRDQPAPHSRLPTEHIVLIYPEAGHSDISFGEVTKPKVVEKQYDALLGKYVPVKLEEPYGETRGTWCAGLHCPRFLKKHKENPSVDYVIPQEAMSLPPNATAAPPVFHKKLIVSAPLPPAPCQGMGCLRLLGSKRGRVSKKSGYSSTYMSKGQHEHHSEHGHSHEGFHDHSEHGHPHEGSHEIMSDEGDFYMHDEHLSEHGQHVPHLFVKGPYAAGEIYQPEHITYEVAPLFQRKNAHTVELEARSSEYVPVCHMEAKGCAR